MATHLKAFSILELMVAAAVFASAVMILLGIFPLSAKAVRQSQLTLIATHMAEYQLETARARNYNALFDDPPLSLPTTLSLNGVTTTIDYAVSLKVDTVVDGLKHVTATVTWTWETPHSLSLETEIARTTP